MKVNSMLDAQLSKWKEIDQLFGSEKTATKKDYRSKVDQPRVNPALAVKFCV
jgi:hypothetical protein